MCVCGCCISWVIRKFSFCNCIVFCFAFLLVFFCLFVLFYYIIIIINYYYFISLLHLLFYFILLFWFTTYVNERLLAIMCAKLLLVCPCEEMTIGVAVDCNGVTIWTARFDWFVSPWPAHIMGNERRRDTD